MSYEYYESARQMPKEWAWLLHGLETKRGVFGKGKKNLRTRGKAGGRKGLKRIKAPLREEDERMRHY